MDKFNWLDKQEYPFNSYYININDYQLHYIDEGQGETLLFVHGTPSWSFDFRNVIKRLSTNYRCIAIDHLGFGLSDKPRNYDYTTQNHSKTLEKFIESKQLKNITLVLHDFGGPIGFDFAVNHPENIKSIIVLNSWLWSSKNDPDFIKFSKILKSPLLPFLYLYFNFSAKYLLPQSYGKYKLPGKILNQYTKAFKNKDERIGSVAFAKSLLHDQDWFEGLWNKKEVLQSKPILFIWGMKDKFVKAGYLDKFLSGFPYADVKKLETCGHFPQEEEPEEVALAIHGFLQKNIE